MDEHSFQYCPKLVIFSKDMKSVLLARRKGENDYDGVYSFVGGKLQRSDESIEAGIKREKDEEIGDGCRIALYTDFSTTVRFLKNDGNVMIVPHFLGIHENGDITLNPEEYDAHQWVPIEALAVFEPKIPNIPAMVTRLNDLYEDMPGLKVTVI
jgi:NADH pyrophosphatase NudC (nudix superfamily)